MRGTARFRKQHVCNFFYIKVNVLGRMIPLAVLSAEPSETPCKGALSYPLSARYVGSKVELEALYTLGMDALTGRFLETAVLRGDFI